ncbi:RhoGAP-domain-containing protein [Backusella circina FSU 941]|nr:RhoGAP-domain-containing protein [Backusella circina FSU 941]
MEGPYCTGCSELIDEGSVIAFGDSLFHLKCFICAKCSEQVDCESNLLLLTNGRPVCESCSYCCNACKQVIRDEAIMTGDEAYHANCFRCVSCKKKIDDLVFTQTSKKMDSNVTLNNSNNNDSNNNNNNNNNSDNDKKEIPEIVKTTENITRASQYLEYSLVSDDYLDGFSNSTEPNAHRKALEELMRAKEEFSKEVALRQQHEYMILQLQHQLQVVFHGRTMTRIELSVITKEEIERVARIKSELDKACGELQGYRDSLAKDIESLAKQKQAGLEINATCHLEEQQKAIAAEIKSLTNDRDHLRTETANLEKIKVSALQDITTMGIKNTEKTQIDIELARCFTEKELTSNLPGSSFLYSPSHSISSELQSPGRKSVDTGIVRKITARDSYNANSQPKIFKLKNKGPGNMFAKLSGKSSSSNSKMDAMTAATAAVPMYGGVSVSSMNLTGEATKRSKVSHDGSGIQHGAHTFQHTSFLRPTKCDSCSEKMWGLSELRCNTCLYVSHGRCLSNVPLMCSGGGRSNSSSSFDLSSTETETEPSNKSSLFGTDISARASTEERSIPVIVEQCINAVEKRGMDYEGIYRKSGGAAQIRLIHQAFDNGEPIVLEQDYPINDIGAITSVLKQYLRELPDPLLTYTLYPTLIDVISSVPDQEKSSKFVELLSQLPKVNFDTLKLLLQHLHKVQERSVENLMTTKNLAMVFGPTLLRDVEATRDLIDMSSKNAVIEYLIVHVAELFD